VIASTPKLDALAPDDREYIIQNGTPDQLPRYGTQSRQVGDVPRRAGDCIDPTSAGCHRTDRCRRRQRTLLQPDAARGDSRAQSGCKRCAEAATQGSCCPERCGRDCRSDGGGSDGDAARHLRFVYTEADHVHHERCFRGAADAGQDAGQESGQSARAQPRPRRTRATLQARWKARPSAGPSVSG